MFSNRVKECKDQKYSIVLCNLERVSRICMTLSPTYIVIFLIAEWCVPVLQHMQKWEN